MAKAATPPAPKEFTITLVDEANPTIDGRIFEPGNVTWREPPLTLMYLTENIGEGHKGSKAGASIQEIWRDGTKIKGRGTFSSGPEGIEMQRMIEEGVLNGVSADVGGAVLEQELAEDGSTQARIMQGKIMGATVLPFPAFDDTRISVVASAVPQEPPVAWFANPGLTGPTPLTITRDGQVFGHAATWNTCHIGKPGTCLTPPRSSSDYAYFRTGEVMTAEGQPVHTGPITLGTGHAGLSLNSRATAEHYDHTGTGIADVVTGEDAHGIWVAGAIRPGVPDERLHALRASALSGDWRTVGGRLELVALLAVNTPGFPIPRTRASFADESEPLALVAAGVVDELSAHGNEELAMQNLPKGDDTHNHNDPTKQHNETDKTPHNAKQDADSEPIHEDTAAKHRASVKEYAAEEGAVEEVAEEELTADEVAELTARLDAVERAVISLAAGRIEQFTADNPGILELASRSDEEDAEEGEED